MIIVGTPLVAVGIAALLGLSYWPLLLIGSGAGMVLFGLKGKFGMIIVGTPLVAVGISALLSLSYWPMLLIGSGAGMVLFGLMGKFGWEPLEGQWGHHQPQGHDQMPSVSDEPA